MRRFAVTVVVVATLVALRGLSATEAPARATAASEPFWKCPAGFAFDVNGSAAHCKKPAYIERKLLAGCTIGLYPAADKLGEKDMCAGTNPVSGEIAVERGCKATDVALGFTKRIVAGTDYCGKAIAPEIVAPSVMVVLTK